MEKMFKGLSIYAFQQQYGTNESCIDALVELKWSKGYSCRYCGYKKYCSTHRYVSVGATDAGSQSLLLRILYFIN